MALQVVSIPLLAAAGGSLLGTVLPDQLGRSKTLLLNALPLVLGAALSATAPSVSAMLAGRGLCGVGIGLASTTVPTYISEIAPKSISGRLGTGNQLAICLGILAALVINVVLPATAWRTMFWLTAAPAVVLAVGALRWHIIALADMD